jgi:uncharacterized protein YebE (UPF0316 family)
MILVCFFPRFFQSLHVRHRQNHEQALGIFILRVIVSEDRKNLVQWIHVAGFGVTRIDGLGSAEPVKLIYTIVKRRHVSQKLAIIHETTSNAFVSVEEVRSTEKRIFPVNMIRQTIEILGRKSK